MLKDKEIIDKKYYYRGDRSDSNSKNVVFIRSLKDTTKLMEYHASTINRIKVYQWHRIPIILGLLNITGILKYDIVSYTSDSKFAIIRIGHHNSKSHRDNRVMCYIPSQFLHDLLPHN